MTRGADDELLARLAELNDRFAAALPQTLARLSAAHDVFDACRPQRELIDQLEATLHTLAGSSATFGFDALGQGARALEARLLVLAADNASAASDWCGWLEALQRFIAGGLRDPKRPYPNDETAV